MCSFVGFIGGPVNDFGGDKTGSVRNGDAVLRECESDRRRPKPGSQSEFAIST